MTAAACSTCPGNLNSHPSLMKHLDIDQKSLISVLICQNCSQEYIQGQYVGDGQE